jgi:hypothetical protein
LGDNQGTVRDLIDDGGNLVEHLSYDSFGKLSNASITGFRYGYTDRTNTYSMRTLKIQNLDGLIQSGKINCLKQKTAPWLHTLKFTSPIDNKIWKFIDVDLFECLIQLRIELSKHGFVALCNGARLNVYPSGMCRDMGGGSSAYVMTLGEPAGLEDLVDILDYAPIELIASIEEQKQFVESWRNSFDKIERLKIQYIDGSIVEGAIIKHIYAGSCTIEFTSTVTPVIECRKINFVECLVYLRIKLHKLNYQVLCNGSRLDTYAFDRDISMIRGCQVYIIEYGKIPEQENQLYIFGDADPSLIASIEKQEEFYRSWLKSIQSIPISEYKSYGIQEFPELYFRLIKIGDLPLMYVCDIESTDEVNINKWKVLRELNNIATEIDNDGLRALSPLSPTQIKQAGCLASKAILGFISDYVISLENFHSNPTFLEFLQGAIATKAPKDPTIQALAIAQQQGCLNLRDSRVSDLTEKEISPEDIIGTFEVKDGQIVMNSYQPNDNYSIFGNNGLMQLPGALHEALIDALLSQS